MPVRKRTRKELEKHPLYHAAMIMFHILAPYPYFKQRELNREAMLTKRSYKQAEASCNIARNLLNLECSPSDFMDDGSCADKAIEYNKKLENELEFICIFDRQCLFSLYSHMQHNVVSASFEMGGFVTYPESILMFLIWAEGKCTLKEFKDSIVEISLFRKTCEPTDSVHFRRDMIRIYNLYNEIYRKKKARIEKKKGGVSYDTL